jgi:hypothetical protein
LSICKRLYKSIRVIPERVKLHLSYFNYFLAFRGGNVMRPYHQPSSFSEKCVSTEVLLFHIGIEALPRMQVGKLLFFMSDGLLVFLSASFPHLSFPAS